MPRPRSAAAGSTGGGLRGGCRWPCVAAAPSMAAWSVGAGVARAPSEADRLRSGGGGIVAGPVQMHAPARLLIEDRRKVAGGMALVRRNGVEQHLHLHQLVGIKGVDPAWSPGRLRSEERLQARAPLNEAFARPGY